MTDFLEQVVASRREYVANAKAARPEADLVSQLPHNAWTRVHQSLPAGQLTIGGIGDAFLAALSTARMKGRLAVIAELKRVSPALGDLARPTLDVADQVRRYTAGGAAAISVLTEPTFWGGSLDDLRTARATSPHMPMLCKDVIVDEYQIVEARHAGADAILLIAEALSDDELRRFVARAQSLSMGALVEAHEAVAFGRAVACGARVVGANARNLRRPSDIDVGRARELQSFPRDEQIFVAESGIESAADARLLPARVDAILVGTALMRADDPSPLIREMSVIRRTGKFERTTTTVRAR